MDDSTFKYLCKIMTLPFLPPCQIPAMFTCLQLQATTEPLQRFVEYVDSTQVQSNSWPHSCRSVYKQQIHTNNDVEGWHNSLNKQEKPRSPFTCWYNYCTRKPDLSPFRLNQFLKEINKTTKENIPLHPSENIKLLGALRLPPKVSSTTIQGLFPCQWTSRSKLNKIRD